MWWFTPLIVTLSRQRQVSVEASLYSEFQASPEYIVRPCLKKKKIKKKMHKIYKLMKLCSSAHWPEMLLSMPYHGTRASRPLQGLGTC